jgi:hypothetical protein
LHRPRPKNAADGLGLFKERREHDKWPIHGPVMLPQSGARVKQRRAGGGDDQAISYRRLWERAHRALTVQPLDIAERRAST